MIRVSLQTDARSQIKVFACLGHAGLTVEDGGEDLLCAGVSALCGALAIGLERVVRASVFLRESRGLFYIRLESMDARLEEQSQLLLRTTIEALRELANYNEGFLAVQTFAPEEAFPTVEEFMAQAEAENQLSDQYFSEVEE